MKNFARMLALFYAVVVGLATIWAWYAEVTLLHSVQEHMLPGMLLAAVSLPTSFTVAPLYDLSPTFFSEAFVQLTWLTVCGIFQASVLYRLAVQKPTKRSVA